MMEPAQQPTNADTRNFPRKVQEAPLRERLRLAEERLREQTKELEESRQTTRQLEQRIGARTIQLAEATRAREALLVAERRAREEAEAANRMKADVLAVLSHEFRTPLQAIFGYTELLERQIHGPLNDAQLRDLQRIQQSQQHLLGLITTILDFARIESAKDIQLHLGATVVDQILREMEGFIGSQLESRGLGYTYECSDKSAAAIADPAKLQRIVLNLLANAIKFTPRDGHISLECVEDSSWVVIRVTDTGIGVPADKLETIFEPFVQIRNRDSSRSEGTGLGLAISRKLATAMGGMLTATSSDGAGSTFTLTLPAIKPDAPAPGHSTPPASPRSRA